MDETEITMCPQCGREPVNAPQQARGRTWYLMRCDHCNITSLAGVTVAEAIQHWQMICEQVKNKGTK